MYTSSTVEDFGGLLLNQDPQQVPAGRAADIKNITLDDRGRATTRHGYAKFTTAAAADLYTDVWHFAGYSPATLMAKRGTGTDAINTVGGITATVAQVGSDFTAYGGTLGQFVYGARFGGTLIKYAAGVFSNVAGSPGAELIAVMPNSNRLALARVNSNQSRVQFSDAGNPETWTATNYLDLEPNDDVYGITALVRWRDLLFAFKRTKFFVFHGETVGPTGQPIFQYDTVDTGVGTETRRVGIAPEGLYFRGGDGVYLTSGGPPVQVSHDITPWFAPGNESEGLFTGQAAYPQSMGSVAGSNADSIVYAAGRVFCSLLSDAGLGTSRVMLVYDTNLRQWTYWADPPFGTGLAAVTAERTTDLYFPYSSSATNDIGLLSSAYTSDAGAAIASHYQSGFYDLGSPHRKTSRETLLWGTGSPTLAVYTDHGSTDANAAAVTLGTSPAVAEGRQRIARRGMLFSHKLSSTTAPWSVNRLTHHIREQRLPGIKP